MQPLTGSSGAFRSVPSGSTHSLASPITREAFMGNSLHLQPPFLSVHVPLAQPRSWGLCHHRISHARLSRSENLYKLIYIETADNGILFNTILTRETLILQSFVPATFQMQIHILTINICSCLQICLALLGDTGPLIGTKTLI